MTVGGSTKASVEEIAEGSEDALAKAIGNMDAVDGASVAGLLDARMPAAGTLATKADTGGGTDWSSKTPKVIDPNNVGSVSGSGYVTGAYIYLSTIDEEEVSISLTIDGTSVGKVLAVGSDAGSSIRNNGASNTFLYRFDNGFDVSVVDTARTFGVGVTYVLD